MSSDRQEQLALEVEEALVPLEHYYDCELGPATRGVVPRDAVLTACGLVMPRDAVHQLRGFVTCKTCLRA